MAYTLHSSASRTCSSQLRAHPLRLTCHSSTSLTAPGPQQQRRHGNPSRFRNSLQKCWKVLATAADPPQEKRTRSPSRFSDLAADDEPSDRIARPRANAESAAIPPTRTYRPASGSPVGSPIASPVGSPVASPVGSPMGSPIGPPVGSPTGSPAGSPVGAAYTSSRPSPAPTPGPIAESIRRNVPRRVSGPVEEERLPYPVAPPSPLPESVNGSAAGSGSEPSEEAVELSVKETSAVRQRLNKKLSEANSYVRHLKRQLDERDAKLVDGMSELAMVGQELKALIELVRMISKEHAVGRPIPKIGDRYAHAVLGTRLEALLVRTELKILDVDSIRVRPVKLRWYGMAQDVRVMGSFDSWTRGEQMSCETTGAENEFSCTLMLRPGKYEIKFVVDGEWRVTDTFPMVGEGFEANNVLVVE
eukprot:jgi/Mesvir1/11411/Mv07774-RA.1